ncbi:MAG: hypothetical protein OEL89_02425, partial [Candidatus Peregrinibacteria bacterium]|nr:hypothetical protein [Candidatus Peregrinibacteria bacterium]
MFYNEFENRGLGKSKKFGGGFLSSGRFLMKVGGGPSSAANERMSPAEEDRESILLKRGFESLKLDSNVFASVRSTSLDLWANNTKAFFLKLTEPHLKPDFVSFAAYEKALKVNDPKAVKIRDKVNAELAGSRKAEFFEKVQKTFDNYIQARL